MTPWKCLREKKCTPNARTERSSEPHNLQKRVFIPLCVCKCLSNAHRVLDWGLQADSIFRANSGRELVVTVCSSVRLHVAQQDGVTSD